MPRILKFNPTFMSQKVGVTIDSKQFYVLPARALAPTAGAGGLATKPFGICAVYAPDGPVEISYRVSSVDFPTEQAAFAAMSEGFEIPETGQSSDLDAVLPDVIRENVGIISRDSQ